MRKWLILLLALLLTALPALAEETPDPLETPAASAAAASPDASAAAWSIPVATPEAEETMIPVDANAESSVPGAFAARTEAYLYAVLPEGERSVLARIPRAGGESATLDRADRIESIVPVDADVFYLRTQDGLTTLARCSADGVVSTVYAFAENAAPHGLSAFRGDLYVLIEDQLHVIYPANGLCLKLVGAKMSEFVIAGDYAYYISLSDILTYETDSLLGGETLTAAGGCLYRLNMTTGNSTLLVKAGVDSLHYAAGMLYFHNLSDDYVMGAGESEWMEGHLYRFDLNAHTLDPVLNEYDWGYLPAQTGVVIYNADALSLLAEDGTRTPLYVPAGYLQFTGDADGLIAYEQDTGKLLLISLDGTVRAAAEGDPNAPAVTVEPGATPGPDASLDPDASLTPSLTFAPDETVQPDAAATPAATVTTAPTATPKPTARPTVKPTPTPKPTGNSGKTDSSYIFKDSSKKKLTTSQILALDRSLWGYARNEIYARHGYEFSDGAYKKYFAKKTWYKPGGFSINDLNATEWYNMDLIKSLEAKYPVGSSIPSGGSSGSSGGSSGSGDSGKTDSSYIFKNSSTKKLTRAQILAIDKSLWPYARNEIYARHGYEFTSAAFQKYFAKKTWYKPGGFSINDLNAIEWYNMDLIKAMEAEYK